MIYREYSKLTIMELSDNEESISFDRIEKVILNKPSNIIYCEQRGKLYGIITMGDIIRASSLGKRNVTVNIHFTCLKTDEYMKARNIFLKEKNINALPIVDETEKLVGDWSRWDDLPAQKRMFHMGGRNYKLAHVAFVRPCNMFSQKNEVFSVYCKNLKLEKVKVECINHDEILRYINIVDLILFVDEDERRAYETLYRYIFCVDFDIQKFQTYKSMYFNTEISKEFALSYLHGIKEKGIQIFNMVFRKDEYMQKITKKIDIKNAEYRENNNGGGVSPNMYKDFFGDTYKKEEADLIAKLYQKHTVESGSGKLTNCKSRFYNVVNGERYTVGQPEPLKYQNTIYFVGPCFVYGAYVEDKNTIESLLQKKINELDYKMKVVNFGSPAHGHNRAMRLKCIMELPLVKGDILILYEDNESLMNIPEIDLSDALKDNNINPGWLIDDVRHCNDRVNMLYMETIFDEVKPFLFKTVQNRQKRIHTDADVIKKLYLDRYFSSFAPSQYNKIGAIIMNCNPFTYGHRYLIEQALNIVEFLIIFVVEEDRSVFTFNERFKMVCEGVSDLENVKVVPSGPFILSQTTFPEYFIKTADENLIENVENDITLFAEKIAPCLNIQYRFVGEEPEDVVTNEYNLAMKRILPKNNIKLIEIPRKEKENRYISASFVRKCLEDNDITRVKKFVPKSTIEVLFQKLI